MSDEARITRNLCIAAVTILLIAVAGCNINEVIVNQHQLEMASKGFCRVLNTNSVYERCK